MDPRRWTLAHGRHLDLGGGEHARHEVLVAELHLEDVRPARGVGPPPEAQIAHRRRTEVEDLEACAHATHRFLRVGTHPDDVHHMKRTADRLFGELDLLRLCEDNHLCARLLVFSDVGDGIEPVDIQALNREKNRLIKLLLENSKKFRRGIDGEQRDRVKTPIFKHLLRKRLVGIYKKYLIG